MEHGSLQMRDHCRSGYLDDYSSSFTIAGDVLPAHTEACFEDAERHIASTNFATEVNSTFFAPKPPEQVFSPYTVEEHCRSAWEASHGLSLLGRPAWKATNSITETATPSTHSTYPWNSTPGSFLPSILPRSYQPSSSKRSRRASVASTSLSRFTCLVCDDMSFASQGDLNHHERYHRQNHPFTCSLCGRTTADRRDARRHWDTHFSSKVWVCQIAHCKRSYTRRDNLQRHQRDKHPEHLQM